MSQESANLLKKFLEVFHDLKALGLRDYRNPKIQKPLAHWLAIHYRKVQIPHAIKHLQPADHTMRIVLCYDVEPHHLEQMAKVVPNAEVVNAGQQGIAEEILDADVYFGHAKVPVPWDQVVEKGQLRWIQSSAAGMDHCLVPPVIESDILVTSASGCLSDQVVEQAMALLLGSIRSMDVFHRAQMNKEYARRPTRNLYRTTIGIVGLGGVGRRLAEVLATFETRILATDWCPWDKPDYVEALWPPDRLEEMAAQVDTLVICAPLNELTRDMIDKSILSKMKPGSFLLNVARGPLVVEDDLVAAVESGHLVGAGLDVTYQEPLPESSKLWDLPGVIITPHVGGQAAWRNDVITDLFCENLSKYLTQEPLRNVVDKRLGFPLRPRSDS